MKQRASSGTGLQSARRAEPEAEPAAELRQVSVELRGREGYNAAAVNGIWRFWRVRGGRLAFTRDVELRVERDDVEVTSEIDEDADDVDGQGRRRRCGGSKGLEEDGGGGSQNTTGGATTGVARVRLFLYFVPQLDTWLISDAPDCGSGGTSGTVAADCGPVGKDGTDFCQLWRVWDGEAWREDRNIVAEVAWGGPKPPNIQGLRAEPWLSLRQRAQSQEPHARPVHEPRGHPHAPQSARTKRTPRR